MSWQKILDANDSAEWAETCAAGMSELLFVDRVRVANSLRAAAMDALGRGADFMAVGVLLGIAESIDEFAASEAPKP